MKTLLYRGAVYVKATDKSTKVKVTIFKWSTISRTNELWIQGLPETFFQDNPNALAWFRQNSKFTPAWDPKNKVWKGVLPGALAQTVVSYLDRFFTVGYNSSYLDKTSSEAGHLLVLNAPETPASEPTQPKVTKPLGPKDVLFKITSGGDVFVSGATFKLKEELKVAGIRHWDNARKQWSGRPSKHAFKVLQIVCKNMGLGVVIEGDINSLH